MPLVLQTGLGGNRNFFGGGGGGEWGGGYYHVKKMGETGLQGGQRRSTIFRAK